MARADDENRRLVIARIPVCTVWNQPDQRTGADCTRDSRSASSPLASTTTRQSLVIVVGMFHNPTEPS